MNKFIITDNDSIMNSLKKIELNKKGFLIVVDLNQKVIGTLTDGDIRRAFIKGNNVDDTIGDIYSKDFKFLYENDDFSKVVKLFKSTKIDFLPIVDEDKILINVITKKNMHVLLMEDIEFDLRYDFLSLNDSILEHEIYDRPWGIYKTTFLNPYSQSKIIKVNPMGELSLQEHKQREEHWVIIYGEGEVILGESVKRISAGSYIFIPKGCKHKLINKSDAKPLMVAEVQLGEYFGEDDIIRYEDVYGRV